MPKTNSNVLYFINFFVQSDVIELDTKKTVTALTD